MSYASVDPSSYNNFSNGITTVDCEKQVRSWRLLRCIMEFLIPSCHCTKYRNSHEEEEDNHHASTSIKKSQFCHDQKKPLSDSTSVFTGTIFRYGRGKLNFCLQKNRSSSDPILLIEMAIPANVLAEEMQDGVLRIALESVTNHSDNNRNDSLLNSPMWVMYCNGRRVGYAMRRRPTEADVATLRMMNSMAVGTGKLRRETEAKNDFMYLRANFKRVCGWSNSESFHLIDPEERVGQELSIFFF